MNVQPVFGGNRPVITALGSSAIHDPLRINAVRRHLHLRKGGFGTGRQSTTLALNRLQRLTQREARFGVGSADITFIEINSRTLLRRGSTLISEDVLERQFPDILRVPHTAKAVWSILAIPDAKLRADALYDSELSVSDHVITALSKISLSHVTTAQMKHDLHAICGLCKNPVIALPYVPVENPEQMPKHRNHLAEEISGMARALGMAEFDPAPLITRFGQNLALDMTDDGDAQYSDGFLRMLAAHLSTHFLSNLTQEVSPMVAKQASQTILSATGGA